MNQPQSCVFRSWWVLNYTASWAWLVFLWPCSLYQKMFCLAKKRVNKKPFLRRTIFFTYQNFLKCHQTFKDAIGKFWRPTVFCQATKSFVPWLLSFVGPSYFASMTIRVSSIDVCLYEKFCLSRRRRPIRLQKQTVGDYRIFFIFFANAQLYFWS